MGSCPTRQIRTAAQFRCPSPGASFSISTAFNRARTQETASHRCPTFYARSSRRSGRPDKENKDPSSPRLNPRHPERLLRGATIVPPARDHPYSTPRALPASSNLGPNERIIIFFAFVNFDAPQILPTHVALTGVHPAVPARRPRFLKAGRSPSPFARSPRPPPSRFRDHRGEHSSPLCSTPFARSSAATSNSARLSRARTKDLNDISCRRPRARLPHRRRDRSRRRDGRRVRSRDRARASASRDAVAPSARVPTTSRRPRKWSKRDGSRARYRLSEFPYSSFH